MDDILLLEAIERYLGDDMSPEERTYFESLRKSTPEVDQLVVEHSMFLHQIDSYSFKRNLKENIQITHNKFYLNQSILLNSQAALIGIAKLEDGTVVDIGLTKLKK